ncbi:MAG: hypothetical protein ACXVHT_12185, partial [Methanobacterium sp.]
MKCRKEYQLEDHENINDFQCICGNDLARPSNGFNKSKMGKMEPEGKNAIKKKSNSINCPYCAHKISAKTKICLNCGREIKPDNAPEELKPVELKDPKKSVDLIIAIFATLNVSLILYFLIGNLAYIFGLFMIIIFISMYTEGKWKFKNTDKSS